MNENVYPYHDSNGLEADSIVQISDERWGAIEVKLGIGVDKVAETLLRLKGSIEDELFFLAVTPPRG